MAGPFSDSAPGRPSGRVPASGAGRSGAPVSVSERFEGLRARQTESGDPVAPGSPVAPDSSVSPDMLLDFLLGP